MESYGNAMEESMVRDTGKTLAQWVEVARSCPETAYKKRLAWFKETHGIMLNRAILIFSALEGQDLNTWDNPEQLVDALFAKKPHLVPLYEEVALWLVNGLPGTSLAPRKAYVGVHNKKQYAVIQPGKDGLEVGIHIPAGVQVPDGLVHKPKGLGGGDRVKHMVVLTGPEGLTTTVKNLLTEAFHLS